MRLDENPLLVGMPPEVMDVFRNQAFATNQISEGRIDGVPNAASSVPTTGLFKVGDFVRNSAPSELGTAGSKYVLFGWLTVTATVPGVTPTPAVFVQMRYLTGN